jgi:putative RecB family exonuclease
MDLPRPVLSPSRASDFTTCPLLFRFRVVDHLPEPPSVEATRGTVVHTVLERLFDLPAPARTPAAAVGLLEPAWAGLLGRDPSLAGLFGDEAALAGWLASAQALVERWFELEDPTRLEPEARELYVEATLAGGLTLRGYVDRLDVAPAGQLRVVDYKTGRAPAPGYESRAMFQLRCYALALWRTRGQVPASLQLVYLGSGDVLRYTPDERDLLATERRVTAIWSAIEQAWATGDWRPRPSRLCDWCHHRALCPEFGGTPPALTSQRTAPLRQVS